MDYSTKAFSMRPKLLASAVRQVDDQREEVGAADWRVLAAETAHRVGTFNHAIAEAANYSNSTAFQLPKSLQRQQESSLNRDFS
jgi:hypothetical protein